MTMTQSTAPVDQRARWRSTVGLDCPTPAANPRRIRYNGTAQLSWQTQAGTLQPSPAQS